MNCAQALEDRVAAQWVKCSWCDDPGAWELGCHFPWPHSPHPHSTGGLRAKALSVSTPKLGAQAAQASPDPKLFSNNIYLVLNVRIIWYSNPSCI